jgi:hypothetical protein
MGTVGQELHGACATCLVGEVLFSDLPPAAKGQRAWTAPPPAHHGQDACADIVHHVVNSCRAHRTERMFFYSKAFRLRFK